MKELDAMEGHMFEYAIADLLFHNGFRDVSVTQGSVDYGIDIFARRKNVKYAIQCKRWKSSVGIKAVQEAISGAEFYHCDAAAVITNSTFTPQAMKLAKTTAVRLWGRDFLEKLLEEYAEEYDEINPQDSIIKRYEKYGQYVEEKTNKHKLFSEQNEKYRQYMQQKTNEHKLSSEQNEKCRQYIEEKTFQSNPTRLIENNKSSIKKGKKSIGCGSWLVTSIIVLIVIIMLIFWLALLVLGVGIIIYFYYT
jgi:hypothetical protein